MPVKNGKDAILIVFFLRVIETLMIPSLQLDVSPLYNHQHLWLSHCSRTQLAIALACVAQLVGMSSINQKVAGSIPRQVEVHMRGNQSMFLFHIHVSLSLSLPSPLSKVNVLQWDFFFLILKEGIQLQNRNNLSGPISGFIKLLPKRLLQNTVNSSNKKKIVYLSFYCLIIFFRKCFPSGSFLPLKVNIPF